MWHYCVSLEAEWATSSVDADAGEAVSPRAGVAAVPPGRRPNTASDTGQLLSPRCILSRHDGSATLVPAVICIVMWRLPAFGFSCYLFALRSFDTVSFMDKTSKLSSVEDWGPTDHISNWDPSHDLQSHESCGQRSLGLKVRVEQIDGSDCCITSHAYTVGKTYPACEILLSRSKAVCLRYKLDRATEIVLTESLPSWISDYYHHLYQSDFCANPGISK